MTTDKELTLPEAATVWANDLQWSWINTEIAKKEAKHLGEDPIHYACTVVPIPPGDLRRNLPPEEVLRKMGHGDIIVKLRRRKLPTQRRKSPVRREGASFVSGQIPIKTWLAYHKKRGVALRGPDGQVINWLWCLFTWDKLGRPVVYAAPGDPFYDLSLYFYPEKLSPQRLQGIVSWLEKHSVTNKFGAC